MKKTGLIAAVLFCGAAGAYEPDFDPLYPNGTPYADEQAIQKYACIKWYPAAPGKNTGVAVVVLPGGSYWNRAIPGEGKQTAQWFADHGITAVICDYRCGGDWYDHPDGKRYGCRYPIPLHDAQYAIRTVRARAAEFGIDPKKIGVIGYSAGGNLAALTLTRFDAGDSAAQDPVMKQSSRPDFGILSYPVIEFSSPITHRDSQKNLFGPEEMDRLGPELSPEKHVTKDTPPVLIWHCNGDRLVSPENSISFYLACRKANVPAELHIFRNGNHGGNLQLWKDNRSGTQQISDIIWNWLVASKFLN